MLAAQATPSASWRLQARPARGATRSRLTVYLGFRVLGFAASSGLASLALMSCLYPPPLALLPRLNLFEFRVHSNPWRGPGAISFFFEDNFHELAPRSSRGERIERSSGRVRGRGRPATSTTWRYIYAGAGAGREGLGQGATEKAARKRSLFNQRQPAV